MCLFMLSGCSAAGLGSNSQLLEALSASNDPDDGLEEIVCIRGTYNGRFADANVSYLKKVYPDGTPPPEC
jgi:cystathionine beta-lyase family protein involved in aluminum resistance